jgi:RNA polymerase sigma-70 factor (ECF subfamily)
MSNLIETYYRDHRDELLAFVSSRLGGAVEAEDIVQNVFLRLLTTDKMITEITLPALTYTIARNLISDYYRHRNTYEEFEHYIKRSSDDYSSMESMESVISAKELTELLERGLARVPENCREIYRMHIYGGMKVGEISQTLGEGYKSVEHRLGAARKALRSFLENYA